MGQIIYSLFTCLYSLAARVISPFNKKAKLWVEGRKNIFSIITKELEDDHRERLWMHCSSLGEFEQGRPLIEELKKSYSRYSIVLTFFSPSGYEHEKNYKGADHIFYMPMDSKKNAQNFFDVVQPKLAVFVKYEFWFYYLNESKKRNIPLLLVSAVFRDSQPFFKWYGNFHRDLLSCFTWLFVQNENSLELLKKINFKNATISGDTRFDRVLEVAENFKPLDGIENFYAGKIVIVAGSTWLEDDEELDHYANTHSEYRFIIAPHDISENRLKECKKLYRRSILYSEFQTTKNDKLQAANVLIIDNIGMLKYLYRYATICYVGGGFGGDGVHNVLEAAVYSKPVVFGPVYKKFIEAVELEKAEGAFSVENAIELEEIFDELLNDASVYETAAINAGNYVRSKTGATENVMRYIQENRLLTN